MTEKIGQLTGKNVMPRPIKAISAIVNTHDIDAALPEDFVRRAMAYYHDQDAARL